MAKDLAGFPRHRVHPDRELYRVHRAAQGPLWYATTVTAGEGGRFDLPRMGGAGTCYVAVSPVGAFLEKFGRLRLLTRALLDDHRLTFLATTTPLQLADLTDRTVLGDFGISGDISTGTDYRPSQELAERLWAAGFDGIYYAARHDPSFTERSIAVFGPIENEVGETPKRFHLQTGPIPRELVEHVEREYRLRVLPSRALNDSDFDLDL